MVDILKSVLHLNITYLNVTWNSLQPEHQRQLTALLHIPVGRSNSAYKEVHDEPAPEPEANGEQSS